MIGSARRILILGWPGSGKSTLARAMARASNIDHVEVDSLYWLDKKGGGVRDDFSAVLGARLSADAWIVEGHYRKIESVLPKPDLILIVRTNRLKLLWRLAVRDVFEFVRGTRATSDLRWFWSNRHRLTTFRADELSRKWQAPVQFIDS